MSGFWVVVMSDGSCGGDGSFGGRSGLGSFLVLGC